MIIRSPRPERSFLTITNELARDERLSYRARGVLIDILSRPDNWQTSSERLARKGEGRDAIRTVLTELEVAGYLTRETINDSDGKIRTIVRVFDQPANPLVTPKTVQPASAQPTPVEPTPVEPSSIEVPSKEEPNQSKIDIEPDHRRLCDLLADLIEQNGSKRPTVTKAWLDAVRLMIRDGRTVDQIEWLIRWSQADEFWRSNILSMPKFRAKFDQMRLRVIADREKAKQHPANGRPQPARKVYREERDLAPEEMTW